MKKLASVLALAGVAALPFLTASVHAQTQAPAAEAPAAEPLTFNIGVVSEYRYRNISQTRGKPALQGGADYAFENGFYLGTWASTITWIKDAGGSSNVEIDIYGGHKGELVKDLSYDVGFLQYYYPNNKLKPDANTLEAYGALTYGPITAKYSHSLTDTFANPSSKGSTYIELAGTFDLGDGLTLTPHVGRQKFTGPVGKEASYTDYSLSLAKDFGGIVPSLTIIGTDANKPFYTVKGAYLGKSTVVAGLKYNF